MKYSYNRMYLKKDDIVKILLDNQSYVILLDDINYLKFERGCGYDYYGGLAVQSPFNIYVPRTGYWFIVICLNKDVSKLHYLIEILYDYK